MYISKIKINNFRNFKEKKIEFTEGVNVIIGHNNAGKTNLLKALALVLDFNGSKRLGIDDFHKNATTTLDDLKKDSPKITIEVTIKGKHDATKTDNDDLVTVSNWLTKLDAEYEALLTYEFFLPTKEKDNPKRKYEDLMNDAQDIKQAWKIIEHDFLRYYVYRIWGGTKDNLNQADSESLQKIDFQFLDAIRDVERDMFSGKSTLLRDVMNYFLDYEEEEETKKKNKIEFSNSISPIVEQVQTRLQKGKAQIQTYAKNTGASFHGNTKPEFDGSISEQDIFTALRLIIRHETGIDIPVSHNGLGYNNLVFISLLLAKMQSDTSKDYKGGNAKVFSILSIEEPEAHLHPSMQYKFLKFLDQNRTQNKVRQIFVSTHSTHITSAVQLDDIICLHNENGETIVGYPGKVFPDNDPKNSKKYIQRFLDTTKSNMLFAQKVILVEGLAEQLLIPTLAKYINAEQQEKFERDNPDKKEEYQSTLLEDNHIAVINVGGRYFEHFLQLFDSEKSPFAIPKKVVCITDRDPERKKKNTEGAKFEKCYPFEYNQNNSEYEYKDNSSSLINQYGVHSKILFFSQDAVKGKTLEYDLVTYNPKSTMLIINGMTNEKNLKELMSFDYTKSIEHYFAPMNNSKEKERIVDGIRKCNWEGDEDKKKAIVASYYLNSVGKGENALDLSVALEVNLSKKGTSEYHDFQVPQYIKDAIEWICQ
ncbi:MAG: AAA family ATPase [Bacteroidetes bacterium]|nr:AAA family ATPase [Bacteroidota bacterium]